MRRSLNLGETHYQEYADANVVRKRIIRFSVLGLSPIWLVVALGIFSKEIELVIIGIVSFCICFGVVLYHMRELDTLRVVFAEKGFYVAKGQKVGKLILIGPDEKLVISKKGKRYLLRTAKDSHKLFRGAFPSNFLSRSSTVPYVIVVP